MNKPKQTKQNAKKFSGALKGAPMLNHKELAIATKNGGLKKISPLDVKYEGTTFGTLIDLHNAEIQKHDELKHKVKDLFSALEQTFADKGYKYLGVDLKDVVGQINTLFILEPHKEYENIILNSVGYVIGKATTSHIVEKGTISYPDDFDKGYYTFVDGEFILDEVLYRHYWGV